MDAELRQMFESAHQDGSVMATRPYSGYSKRTDEFTTRAMVLIQQEIAKAKLEAQLGMIDYYDQAPTNDSCNWKGLLADNRKQIEWELSQTLKEHKERV